MSTLLLVDDDDDLRSMLKLTLEDEGFRVVEAADAETALYQLAIHAIDIALVDIRLPGMSGLDLCRSIREQGDLPIVAVTAQIDDDDIAAGLKAGANDYVAKPVVTNDLVARLKRLERRKRDADEAPSTIEVRDLVIRLPEGEVERNGQRLRLTPTEAQLLIALTEQPGLVVLRELLLERVWGPDRFDDMQLVDHAISRLRAKLEDEDKTAPYIVRLYEGGYRFVP